MIFSVKDSLRQAVEAASGGLATVMYTKKGQPVFLRRIPRFNLEDIDPSLGTGPHPAFVVGDRVVSEIWIGMYPGVISQGELVSVPGVAPTIDILSNALAAAQASGPGFHLLTNAEYAAVALLHLKANGGVTTLRGNSDRGRSHSAPWETGVRVDGRSPGDTTGDSRVLTGSGPLTWRHDGSPSGIDGLVGHSTLVSGLRLDKGEIQVQIDGQWYAILPSGELVSPNTSGTLKFDIGSGQSYSDNNVAEILGLRLRTTRTAPPPGWDETNANQDLAQSALSSLAADSGVNVPSILKAHLLYLPVSGWTVPGTITTRPYGTRYATRGGPGTNTSLFGLGSALISDLNPIGNPRPAFVL